MTQLKENSRMTNTEPRKVEPSVDGKAAVLHLYRRYRRYHSPSAAMGRVETDYARLLAAHAYLAGEMSERLLDRYTAASLYRASVASRPSCWRSR